MFTLFFNIKWSVSSLYVIFQMRNRGPKVSYFLIFEGFSTFWKCSTLSTREISVCRHFLCTYQIHVIIPLYWWRWMKNVFYYCIVYLTAVVCFSRRKRRRMKGGQLWPSLPEKPAKYVRGICCDVEVCMRTLGLHSNSDFN